MKERLITLLMIGVTVSACAVFTSTLVHASLFSPQEEEVIAPVDMASSTAARVKDPRAPGRLIIPSLGIHTAVQDVGRGKSGNMAVPSNYDDVGWYRYGPRPGEVGSAVIDGHVDNGLALDAVFKRLPELQVGDNVFIETKGGKRLRFIVLAVETYHMSDVPLDLVFNRVDSARLNLITCAGDWLPEEKIYDQRVVVYTKLAP